MSRPEHESDLHHGSTAMPCPLQAAKITIRVIRTDTKQPVGEANVILNGPTNASKPISAATGTAQFDAVNPGDYTIQVTMPISLSALFKGPTELKQKIEPKAQFVHTVEIEARVFLRLKLFRGASERKGWCKVALLKTEDDEAGSELAVHGPVEIQKGVVEVLASVEVANEAKYARLYFVNEQGEETGEGLSLRIDAAAPITGAKAAWEGLRGLGFQQKEPIASDETTAAQHLDLELALARFQRTQGESVGLFAGETLSGLEAAYLDYSYQPASLPRLDYPDTPKTQTTIGIRLRWMRGEKVRSGNCRVILDIDEFGTELHRIDSVAISDGNIDITVPGWIASWAKVGRVYMLGGDGEETGEALYLMMSPTRDILDATTVSQVLRCLGFYDKEPLKSRQLTDAVKLEGDLALARYQRSQGETVAPASEDLVRALEKGYLEYTYGATALPSLNFKDSKTQTTIGIRLRWMRGEKVRSGNCRVILDIDEFGTELHRIDSVAISDGNIDITVPGWIASWAKVGRVYMLGGDGEETGEALYLMMSPTRDILDATTVSQVLRCLGFYDKEPLKSRQLTDAVKLEGDLALARYQRSQGETVAPANAESVKALEAAYLEYSYHASSLPSLT